MTLLDQGRDTVTVYQDGEVVDEYGTPRRVPGAVGVDVPGCRVQPLGSGDGSSFEEGVTRMYKVIARTLPLGPWSRVEWRGDSYDILGEVMLSNGSDRTRHAVAIIRSRTPRV